MRRILLLVLVVALAGALTPTVSRAVPLDPVVDAAGQACVETPRPDASIPALVAQRAAFGFHDEELVLCSPGADVATHLAARLWVPPGCEEPGSCPGVLVVHGFGANKELTFSDMRELVLRGFTVLSYDVRGQGASGGQVDLMGRDTIVDEGAVLDWFHREVQPTSTGVYGISQGGAHALMAAIYNCGPARAAAVAGGDFDSTIPCDEGGTRWVDAVVPVQSPTSHMDDGVCMMFMASALGQSRLSPQMADVAASCLADGTAVDAQLEAAGGAANDDELRFDAGVRSYLDKVDRIDVPVYLATSYFDRLVPTRNTTELYEALRTRIDDDDDGYDHDVRMIISNDAHGDIGSNFAVLSDLFSWLEWQLEAADNAVSQRSPEATVAIARAWDANTFQLESSWPIAGMALEPFAVGGIDHDVLALPVPASSPGVPLAGNAWPRDGLHHLPDAGVTIARTVETDTEINGLPWIDLWVSSDHPHGQVHVTLLARVGDDVTEIARSRSAFEVVDGGPTHVAFPLSMTGWRLPAGSTLELEITGADPFETSPTLGSTGFTVHVGPDTPSGALLPIVPIGRTAPAGEAPSGVAFTADPIGGICAGLGAPCG